MCGHCFPNEWTSLALAVIRSVQKIPSNRQDPAAGAPTRAETNCCAAPAWCYTTGTALVPGLLVVAAFLGEDLAVASVNPRSKALFAAGRRGASDGHWSTVS